ncbi:MAG: cytochrome C biogenesis protein [Sphingopyxis sp.]|nr:MAG: cytochrome C biogenesis protein [Sphingopyxis sp.]
MKRFLVLLVLSLSAPIAAQTGLPPAPYADRQLDDPRQEAAARDLMEELRCLKCQSQSIADSNAPMAGDMRSQVRERIAAGETPEAVRSWLIERYGNWVSYDPPIASAVTWPLWIAPIVLLLAALWLARGRFRKSKGRE